MRVKYDRWKRLLCIITISVSVFTLFFPMPGYSLSVLQQNLVDHLNQEDFAWPCLNGCQLAMGEFTGEVTETSRGWRAFLKGTGVALGTVGGGLLGFVIGGPVGAGIGCAAAAAGYGTAAMVLNTEGSIVEDIVFYDAISVEGQGDVTGDIIILAQANIVETVALNWSPDQSVSIINPAVFSPVVKTESGKVVSEILGIDTLLMNRRGRSVFGVVVYNDPMVTGRVLAMTDVVELDLSAITSQPSGTAISYNATLLIGADNIEDKICCVPEPSTILLLGSGLAGLVVFGRKRLFKKTRP